MDIVPVEIDEARVAPAKAEHKPPIQPGIAQCDFTADPGEKTNVYREDSPSGQRLMKLLLDHFYEGVGPRNSVPVDEEMLRKLRALGDLQ